MYYDLILANGTIVTSKKSFKGDIAVKNGKIINTGKLKKSDTADDIYDAEGKYILPGIIDAHVHFRDPGLTEKEDFETGSIAAAFGGITTVADMPNVIPVTSTAKRFNEKVEIAREKSYVDFGLFALLTNENTDRIEELGKAGALGFKVFLGYSTGDIACPNAGVLYEQMQKAKVRIGFHCENSEINSYFTNLYRSENGVLEGVLFSQARPVLSEILAINTVISLAQYTKAKIHIHHVTSRDGCFLIAEAKKKGVALSAETCPHYLLLNAQSGLNKVYPPIRDENDHKGLWEALAKGTIDMIASDHAPHTSEEKKLPLWESPAGLCGVETFVPLMLNEVNKGKLTLNEFVRLASEAPAKIWGIYPKKGSLLSGTDADFTVVDMNKKRKINAKELHSKNKTSPFEGMEVKGIPEAAIVRGKFVVKDGNLMGRKGYGVLVSPALL
jgi:dihydroorotase (multifunctional complex type)